MHTENHKNELSVKIENINSCLRENRAPRLAEQYQILVADKSLKQRDVCINDPVPTGQQVLDAAGYIPTNDFMLLILQGDGMLEEVNLTETVDVYQRGVEKFIAFESDRIFYFELNGKRFPWGDQYISEEALRKIGHITENQSIWLEHQDEKDEKLNKEGKVDLSLIGLEKLYSKRKTWKLNVHGVKITSENPTILASDAMNKAGFNPAEGWILILKVKGEPKQSITINDEIDLTKPGIEKLRLTPAEINNGEAVSALQLDFSLLDKDDVYLNNLNINWETVIDAGRRWLIIRDYVLPEGYNHATTDVAIDIPTMYPDAALDMFYCNPPLRLSNNVVIAQTESVVSIGGVTFQRWSRHLNGATRWNTLTDSIITQMAVVEESLLREVGE